MLTINTLSTITMHSQTFPAPCRAMNLGFVKGIVLFRNQLHQVHAEEQDLHIYIENKAERAEALRMSIQMMQTDSREQLDLSFYQRS